MSAADRYGVYVASRTHHADMWKATRDEEPIISTWIDEAGAGETADLGELWARILDEVTSARALVLYVEAGDFPLKGALVEVGMALAADVPIFLVLAPDVTLEPRSMRPLGSWAQHPSVTRCYDLLAAFNTIRLQEMNRLHTA